MSELTPEEQALLAAAEGASAEETLVEEPTPEVVEEPKKRGRKPRAATTDVEPDEDEPEATLPETRVTPAQHGGDPWGDTPAQSRF